MEQTIKVSREGSRALTTVGDALDIRLEQILLHDRNPSIEPDYELGEGIMTRLECLSYWIKNRLFGLSSDVRDNIVTTPWSQQALTWYQWARPSG